ncbi:DUF2845 domain-containing protein [Pseudomonas panipatensis]|jgi:hypothetical protein|uniref:DUF2845 domain-containing protein n=1 Tax=Pseudomonas panipatensis TaxID=428992 RepID=UPI000B7D814F|nr:DUF2845 domain-containing protein [Pseudomonas panipatensis]
MKYLDKCLFGLLLLALLPPVAHASSLRCSRGIASEGDTKDQVLQKCGEPVTREVWGPALLNNGVPKKGAAQVEYWRYGPDGGVYRKLRFIDERLVQVETEWK